MACTTALVIATGAAVVWRSSPIHVPAPEPAAAESPVRRLGPISPMAKVAADLNAEETLGQLLFHDPRLAGDGRTTCATCHDLTTNGAGRRAHDPGVGGKPFPLNTPTVFNAAANFRLNWRGNFRDLESHTLASIENPRLMGGSMSRAVEGLRRDEAMTRRFREVYGRSPDGQAVVRAISQFERTLATPDARFDLWLKGDKASLSAQEIRGYRVFREAGCVSCHQGANVGGNLYQLSGVFHPLTPDGRGSQAMRVPSLRNVAVTAPYFHDGSAATLNDAVRAMSRAQLNLILSDQQTADIVAFLNTLTGNYRGRPVRAPNLRAPGS